jgi:hypothetical protein
MMGYSDFGSIGGFGWVWMVLVVAVVIALVIWGAAASRAVTTIDHAVS